MNCSRCSSLLLLVLLTVAQAQQKTAAKPQPPTKPKTLTVNCSEAQTSKACSSFKQLLEAHDKGVLDSLSSPTSYVCFRPNADAFLIIHADEPAKYGWKESDDGVGQTSRYKLAVSLAEYRDGVSYGYKTSRGYWRQFTPDEEPMFSFDPTEGSKGFGVSIVYSEIQVIYVFMNKDGGKSFYSLIIRGSTGRFIETFDADDNSSTTNSGTCLIYR